MANCSCSDLLKKNWGTKNGENGSIVCQFCDKPVYELRSRVHLNLNDETLSTSVPTFATDMTNVFKEASVGFKIQLIWFVLFIFAMIAVGFGYLTGSLEVEKTPTPVVTSQPITNLCSERTGECYDIDPTEPFVDEFPSRP